MSGVFAASGASASAPSTARESRSEKSGRLRWRSIIDAVRSAEVGLATPLPAMSAATGLVFFCFFGEGRERVSFWIESRKQRKERKDGKRLRTSSPCSRKKKKLTVPGPLLEDRRPFPDVAPGHHPGSPRQSRDDVGDQIAVEVGGDLIFSFSGFFVFSRSRSGKSELSFFPPPSFLPLFHSLFLSLSFSLSLSLSLFCFSSPARQTAPGSRPAACSCCPRSSPRL